VELPKILGFDYCEFYVGNAKQAARYYQTTFGFSIIGYKGLETGNRDMASYVLKQNKIIIILTSGYDSNSKVGKHVLKHGDGIRTIGLSVQNLKEVWEKATREGAKSLMPPTEYSDEDGSVFIAEIQTFGDTIHTLIERNNYKGRFLPGFQNIDDFDIDFEPAGLVHIDHLVGNQPDGEMEPVVQWYEKVFGFHRFWTVDDSDISTEFTSLRSIVVSSPNEIVKMPINEPAEGLKKSQIQEFVDFYESPGIQHLALSTRNIIKTVKRLKAAGLKFLDVPSTYYTELPDRVGTIDEDMKELEQLGILVDKDDNGYLLQIFSEPIQDRPTFFFEIIQRKGCQSFGKGNFKALFISIERAQEKRGNL